jgi:multidrug resistance efflux pump
VSDTPDERLARWTSRDAAIGTAAEVEQLRARLSERDAEVEDLRARLAQLTTRVAQVEADNVDLRRAAGRVPLTGVVGRVYRGLRARAALRFRR